MKFEININEGIRDEVFKQVKKMNDSNLYNYANAVSDIEEKKIKAEASTVIYDIIRTVLGALEDEEMGNNPLDSYYGSENTIKIIVE